MYMYIYRYLFIYTPFCVGNNVYTTTIGYSFLDRCIFVQAAVHTCFFNHIQYVYLCGTSIDGSSMKGSTKQPLQVFSIMMPLVMFLDACEHCVPWCLWREVAPVSSKGMQNSPPIEEWKLMWYVTPTQDVGFWLGSVQHRLSIVIEQWGMPFSEWWCSECSWIWLASPPWKAAYFMFSCWVLEKTQGCCTKEYRQPGARTNCYGGCKSVNEYPGWS